MDKIMVSPGEIELIKVLWQNEKPLTVGEIIAQVQTTNNWSKNTIATMLNRLVSKKAVERQGSRRSYLFAPLLNETQFKDEAINKLTGQFFNGSIGALLNFFARDDNFSAHDIAELKALIDKYEAENE